MSVQVALNQRACLLSAPDQLPLLPTGQQTYLPLRMFDYVEQDQHACLMPISPIRLADIAAVGVKQ